MAGRVQGVGFRWFIQTKAEKLGIRGWARNLPDGSVEVAAMAKRAALESFERIVRAGPPGASVTGLTASDLPHEAVEGKSFQIRR